MEDKNMKTKKKVDRCMGCINKKLFIRKLRKKIVPLVMSFKDSNTNKLRNITSLIKTNNNNYLY